MHRPRSKGEVLLSDGFLNRISWAVANSNGTGRRKPLIASRLIMVATTVAEANRRTHYQIKVSRGEKKTQTEMKPEYATCKDKDGGSENVISPPPSSPSS